MTSRLEHNPDAKCIPKNGQRCIYDAESGFAQYFLNILKISTNTNGLFNG